MILTLDHSFSCAKTHPCQCCTWWTLTSHPREILPSCATGSYQRGHKGWLSIWHPGPQTQLGQTFWCFPPPLRPVLFGHWRPTTITQFLRGFFYRKKSLPNKKPNNILSCFLRGETLKGMHEILQSSIEGVLRVVATYAWHAGSRPEDLSMARHHLSGGKVSLKKTEQYLKGISTFPALLGTWVTSV